MKQFIVLTATLPLMLVFFAQFSLDQINNTKIVMLSEIVYEAKEDARQAGYFSPGIIRDMKQRISKSLNTDVSDIFIDATDTPRYRLGSTSDTDPDSNLIYYKITVPIGYVMAGGSLFGIRNDDNVYLYTLEGYAASELLPVWPK